MWKSVVQLVLATSVGASLALAEGTESSVRFDLRLDVIRRGYDGATCMVQARTGIIPRDGQSPILVTTMSPLVVAGSDVYLGVHDMRSDDGGKTWTSPMLQPDLDRRPAGMISGKPAEIVPGDLWPKWHAASGRLLAIGQTFHYVDDVEPARDAQRATCYSVYDPEIRRWLPWKVLMNRAGDGMYPYLAGCVQRLDLPNGEILLPLSGGEPYKRVRVARLAFDGETLSLLEEGNELRKDTARGFAEPSLARFRGTFFLTIRHDEAGYVCTSDDGLHFSAPRPWLWDDGTDLGSYTPQTHWVTHDEALFLVYTRRGANNDHVFRHRAPLFIAEVDPVRLCVNRATERVAVPERGARLGNFGITEVSEQETWIVTGEWMQTWKQASRIIPVDNAFGADNSTYAARVVWAKPNTSWNRR
jgi:hypothetical protein